MVCACVRVCVCVCVHAGAFHGFQHGLHCAFLQPPNPAFSAMSFGAKPRTYSIGRAKGAKLAQSLNLVKLHDQVGREVEGRGEGGGEEGGGGEGGRWRRGRVSLT